MASLRLLVTASSLALVVASAPRRARAEDPAASAAATAPPPAQPTSVPTAATTAPPKRPVTQRPWFWGVIGGAVVLVAAGVVIGVTISQDNTRTLPSVSF